MTHRQERWFIRAVYLFAVATTVVAIYSILAVTFGWRGDAAEPAHSSCRTPVTVHFDP